MKKIIYLFIIAFAALAFSSCQEKIWQKSELTQTIVLKATIASSDKEAYYIYPERDFVIYQSNVNLNKYPMADYSYTQSDEETTINFRATLTKDTYANYEMVFSAITNSGRLTTRYFENEVEQIRVQSITALSSTTEYIDLN